MRGVFRCLEGFAEQWRTTGIPHIQGTAINDEVIKGFYLGIPAVCVWIWNDSGHVFQEMENLIGAYGLQLSLRINSLKLSSRRL